MSSLDDRVRDRVEGVEVGLLRDEEVADAIGVLARGMRDSPMHVAVFGPDPERRVEQLSALFGTLFDILDMRRHVLVARLPDGTIAGVCGMIAPEGHNVGLLATLRILARVLRFGPRVALRALRWQATWAAHDLKERHWHLGPVAVEPRLQGRGIGSRMMTAFCDQMDAAGEVAWLETDKAINVTFYERLGFEVAHRQTVLGFPNWFMRRDPRPGVQGT